MFVCAFLCLGSGGCEVLEIGLLLPIERAGVARSGVLAYR